MFISAEKDCTGLSHDQSFDNRLNMDFFIL